MRARRNYPVPAAIGRMIGRNRVVPLLALFAPLCLLADEAPGAAASIELLDRLLLTFDSFRADFEQSVIDAEGAVVDRSRGSLEIDRPGRFRWITREPYEQWLLADGLNVWSYDVDVAQVTVKPQAQALANTPALLLGGGREALDAFAIDAPVTGNGRTSIRLVPEDRQSGFRSVDLVFVGDMLARLVFLDTLEQRTVVSFSAVEIDVALTPARFVFVMPEDADLVGTPASSRTP